MSYSGGRDLEIMGARGVTVSHCPGNISRRGRSLDSWPRYREAGVNLALGTDTYPRDLIMQMRIASYVGKVVTHDLFAAPAARRKSSRRRPSAGLARWAAMIWGGSPRARRPIS